MTWTLAFVRKARSSSPMPRERSWIRGLFALALLDTVIALVLVSSMPRLTAAVAARTRALDAPRIGVLLDEGAKGAGCRVRRVLPASPAASAGLQSGDRLLAVDGERVADCAALRRVVKAGAAGMPRRFRLRRGARVETLAVTPVRRLAARALQDARKTSKKAAEGVFAATTPCGAAPGPGAGELRALAVLLGLLFVTLWGWRKGALRSLPVYGLLAISLTAGYVGLPWLFSRALCALQGGSSLGTFLLALSFGPGCVAILLAVALPRLRRQGALAVPAAVQVEVSGAAAFGLGLGYALAGLWRLRVAGLLLESWLPKTGASDPAFTGLLQQGTASAGALALLVLAAVLIGPLTEELMMRGLLLPWLAGWLDARIALPLSALAFGLLHPQYGSSDLLVIVWLGWVFGWARLRSGRLLPAIALHAAFNALGVAVATALR